MSLRKMVNMARTADEQKDSAVPQPVTSLYDYGLTLRFNHETLEKLDLETCDVEVGDMLHLMAMAEVTSVSKYDSGDGEKCCVELTLTHIGLENEDTEYNEE